MTSPRADGMSLADPLGDLGADTDLGRLVHRVRQEQLPWVVVSSHAISTSAPISPP
jgi:hypothetical protein